MELPFDESQLRFLRALAEALFDGFGAMAISIDEVVANIETQFALIGGTKAQEVSWDIRLAQVAMGPLFEELSVAHRKRRIEERMRDSGFHLFKEMARLRSIVYVGYYGHWIDRTGHADRDQGESANQNNPVHRQIGFTLPRFRTRGAGEVPLTPVEGRDIDPAHVIRFDQLPEAIDVVVVGSGAGGAVSAYNLAKAGHRVLVIEAGPFFPSHRITHEERRMTASLFKHGGLQTTRDNDFVVFQGRSVGGSPNVNNGICLRMKGDPLGHLDAPDVFARWRAIGAPLDEARFLAAYDHIGEALGIGPAEPRSGRGNGTHLLDSWAAFAAGSGEGWAQRARSGWFTKNFGPPGTDKACAYCGYCNTGCHYGRRVGMAQSFLPWACSRHGARILPETKVEKIVWGRGEGGQRRAVAVSVIDPDGAPHLIAVNKGVVVAAGTIASSLLLERSGIEGTGNQISLNVASPMIALMCEAATPSWNEDQMTSMVDCGEFMLESHFQSPMLMAAEMPGWFGEMDRRMRAYGRVRSAGILFPADRRGRLVGGKLQVDLTQDDLALVRRALGTLARVHFAGGAEEVWPALLKGPVLTPDSDIDAVFHNAVREAADVTLSSSHPHGGNPISTDPEAGVVDPQCRLHGAENVLVTDASVFPSTIRVNAQFTTMAMAHYATGAGDVFAGVG